MGKTIPKTIENTPVLHLKVECFTKPWAWAVMGGGKITVHFIAVFSYFIEIQSKYLVVVVAKEKHRANHYLLVWNLSLLGLHKIHFIFISLKMHSCPHQL